MSVQGRSERRLFNEPKRAARRSSMLMKRRPDRGTFR